MIAFYLAVACLSPMVLLGSLWYWRRGEARPAPQSPTGRRPTPAARRRLLAAVASGVAVLAIVASLAIGYFAYEASRKMVYRSVADDNLLLSRLVALEFGGSRDGKPLSSADRAAALKRLETSWLALEQPNPDMYLCVVQAPGVLTLHTATPELVGADMRQVMFAREEGSSVSVERLLAERQGWAGEYVNLLGHAQVIGAAYAPALESLVVVHVPASSLSQRVWTAAVPWLLAIALVAGFMLPASLGWLHFHYAQTDQALQLRETQLQDIAANFPGSIFSLVSPPDRPPYLEYVSDGARTLFGMEMAAVLGPELDLAKVMHPDDVERARENLRAGDDTETSIFLGRVVGVDGQVRWIHTSSTIRRRGNGELVRYGVALDVTEQKRIEAELREQTAELTEWKNRFEAAVLASGHVYYDWNPDTGAVMGGGSLEALVGSEAPDGQEAMAWWTSLVHPDDRPLFDADLERLLRDRSSSNLRYRVRHKDGHDVHVLDRGRFFYDRDGRPTRMVGFVIDVTPLAVAQRALEELNASLWNRVAEQTAELRAKNADLEAFAHTVSHDLRAPLRAIEGFAEALKEDYGQGLDETGRQFLQNIITAAMRMDVLIRDLLAYSRLGQQDLPVSPVSPVAWEAVVDQTLAELASEISASGARVAVERPLPGVAGHFATLVQALTNLVGNALKFTQPGVSPQVRIWAERREGAVRLWVEDRGIGIDPRHHASVFRAFERLHGIESYPGTGIGLAIVARAAERLHGQCGLESQPGEGSRFWIELPAAD